MTSFSKHSDWTVEDYHCAVYLLASCSHMYYCRPDGMCSPLSDRAFDLLERNASEYEREHEILHPWSRSINVGCPMCAGADTRKTALARFEEWLTEVGVKDD